MTVWRLFCGFRSVSGGCGFRRMSYVSRSKLEDIKKEFRSHEGGRITLTKNGDTGIAYICLDHPEKKNGLSGNMMVQLNEAVDELEKWKEGKAVVLHANGDTFCSGGYISTVLKILNSEAGERMSSLMQDSVLRLANLPLPSVAVVRGKAIGGGAELTVSTDFRLFTPSAEVRFVQARMGVATGWGGGTSLQRLLGRSKALHLLLSGCKVTAEEAKKIGLADEVLSSDEGSLEEATRWMLNLIQNYKPEIVQSAKQIVACDSHEREKEIFAKLWGGEDQVKAFNSNIKHK